MNQTAHPLLEPDEIAEAGKTIDRLLSALNRVVLGQEDLHRMVLAALLSRGHVLLEGVPGVGKTLLVKTLSRLLGLDYRRIQFTPDLMPGDILGHHILQQTEDGTRKMIFEKGPVFTHILLADEINRASPKTQSALLEAMQEQAVTLMGKTRRLPSPFFVLATQNPIELEGTYPLPEAQVDRFLFKLRMNMAPVSDVETLVATRRRGAPPLPEGEITAADLENLFTVMDRMYLPRPVAAYISRLTAATHPDGPEATDRIRAYVSYGASPRAAIAMAESALALALMDGRPTAGFEDVRGAAVHALNHRIIPGFKARMDGVETRDLAEDLLASLDETGMELPEGVEVQ